MTIAELATKGSKIFYKSLKNFINDSKLIYDIYDRVDKIFNQVAQTDKYFFINDIAEENIFDDFINKCIKNGIYQVDVKEYIYTNFDYKSQEAKDFCIEFFSAIKDVIFDVLSSKASLDTKLILAKLDKNEQQDKILSSDIEKTIVVKYTAIMQNKPWGIAELQKYIKDKQVDRYVDLSNINSTNLLLDSKYWFDEKKRLENIFNRKLTTFLDEGISIDLFGLAPIPLLIYLGNLFANYNNLSIHQLSKNPSTWEWRNGEENSLNIKVKWHNNQFDIVNNDVVIMLSFSGKVKIENISKVVDCTKIPIVEMYIDEPYDDFLQSEYQLNEFITAFRKIKSQIYNYNVKNIHLFAAIPVAFAIGIGQCYNPNFDCNLITYNYFQNNYKQAIKIGEKNEELS